MSDRYGSYPPDEPVIGATYPPPPPLADDGYYDDEGAEGDYDPATGEWDDGEYAGEYEDDEDSYYDDYYEDTPTRQPMFYVFIGMAALIGGIVIFLLFSALNSGGSTAASKPPVDFKVLVNSPTDGTRIATGQTTNVAVQATSTEPITKFELFLDGRSVASQPVTTTPPNNTYSATLTLPPLTERRNYKLFVRVTSSSGATKDSDAITIVGIESVGDRPVSIQASCGHHQRAERPRRQLRPPPNAGRGQTVTIIGKSSDTNWLLIDLNGEKWVKRSAINELDSLALVPVRDATPVPQPTATQTPAGRHAHPQRVSFAKRLANDGRLHSRFLPRGRDIGRRRLTLRVTIANNSNAPIAGRWRWR